MGQTNQGIEAVFLVGDANSTDADADAVLGHELGMDAISMGQRQPMQHSGELRVDTFSPQHRRTKELMRQTSLGVYRDRWRLPRGFAEPSGA